jgi:hypothetical protein
MTAATTTVPCARIENIVPQRDFSEIIDVRKDLRRNRNVLFKSGHLGKLNSRIYYY